MAESKWSSNAFFGLVTSPPFHLTAHTVKDVQPNSAGKNTTYYRSHWDKVYLSNTRGELLHEWHLAYEVIKPLIDPYVRNIIAVIGTKEQCIVDVGCGGSSLGVKILQDYDFGSLLLADLSVEIVRVVQARHEHDARVNVVAADCRSLPFVQSNSVAVLIDKGTWTRWLGMPIKRACWQSVAGFSTSVVSSSLLSRG